MANTVQMLQARSDALKNSIQSILGQLKQTNNEIVAQIEINRNDVEKHNKDIEQLHKDNADLEVLKADNEEFIANVGNVIAEDEQN